MAAAIAAWLVFGVVCGATRGRLSPVDAMRNA